LEARRLRLVSDVSPTRLAIFRMPAPEAGLKG